MLTARTGSFSRSDRPVAAVAPLLDGVTNLCGHFPHVLICHPFPLLAEAPGPVLNWCSICVGWAFAAAGAFPWLGRAGLLRVAVSGLLLAAVSLAADRRLLAHGRRWLQRSRLAGCSVLGLQ